MPDHRDNPTPPDHFSAFAGLPAALLFALLLMATFGVRAFQVTMPPAERWAALTVFALLTLAYLLQGSAGLYDMLGQVVRRDMRALAVLVALVPALYVSYSISVDEFSWFGLLTALVFVSLPTVALVRNKHMRTPTVLDFVATGYVWVSVALQLMPNLQLPQQGGQVGFFAFSAIPLLLLLLAARGWPGLGFTWFLSWSDLRIIVLTAAVLLLLIIPLALAIGFVSPSLQVVSATDLLSQAVSLYFFVALPYEVFFRGIFQNGIERTLGSLRRTTDYATPAGRWLQPICSHARMISLILAALLFSLASGVSGGGRAVLLAFLAGLGYGYVYQRTGKVTASAVVHLLLIWCWGIFLM